MVYMNLHYIILSNCVSAVKKSELRSMGAASMGILPQRGGGGGGDESPPSFHG